MLKVSLQHLDHIHIQKVVEQLHQIVVHIQKVVEQLHQDKILMLKVLGQSLLHMAHIPKEMGLKQLYGDLIQKV